MDKIFLIEDDDLWEKYNTIWDKVSPNMKKEFDSKSVCDKEFLNSMVMKLQIFMINISLKWTLIILAVISLDAGLK